MEGSAYVSGKNTCIKHVPKQGASIELGAYAVEQSCVAFSLHEFNYIYFRSYACVFLLLEMSNNFFFFQTLCTGLAGR